MLHPLLLVVVVSEQEHARPRVSAVVLSLTPSQLAMSRGGLMPQLVFLLLSPSVKHNYKR